MDIEYLLPLFGRLTVALVLGGLIGYQRERRRHPAGLRTHMLVALGSALFTLISESYAGNGQDPSRIAAQVVSGIGFLGAGTIIRHGTSVRGLTTAASLWTVAGIGMGAARGGPVLWLTVFATFLALITLTLVDVIEDRYLVSNRRRNLTVFAEPEAVASVLQALAEAHVAIYNVARGQQDSTGAQQVYIHVKLPRGGDSGVILRSIVYIEGVRAARWDENERMEVEGDA